MPKYDAEKWEVGEFVRVREGHPWGARAGKDAMIVEDAGDGVAVIFAFDRSGYRQNVHCVGRELWLKSEFDESTLTLRQIQAQTKSEKE